MPSLTEVGESGCTTSYLVLPGFLIDMLVGLHAKSVLFCLHLFQVLLLFVALGVFLLSVRKQFVENPLVDVRELKEIFMIIGGMYSLVIMSVSRHCGGRCR